MKKSPQKNGLARRRERAIQEVEDFINCNWKNHNCGWPTEWAMKPAQPVPQAAMKEDSSLNGMTVYIQGVFYLDRSVFLDVPQQEFLAALRENPEKLWLRWAFNGCEVGGYPAHAIRTARAKGARVTVGAILPSRLPSEFDRFFEEQKVDTRYLCRSAQGPVPQTLKLHFADGGHLLFVDRGCSSYAVQLPAAQFDVLLLNPGGRDTRRPLLNKLRQPETARHKVTVGLVGRGDWTRDDWDLIKDTDFRVYLNQQELTQATATMASDNGHPQVEVRLANLRRTVGPIAVTVTLGKRGSMTMNHVPFLTHATAAQVSVRSLVGPGDTLATTATLSAAAGALDGRNCLRGNMDACRLIEGRPPATSLLELDHEITRRPEMIEQQIPLPN